MSRPLQLSFEEVNIRGFEWDNHATLPRQHRRSQLIDGFGIRNDDHGGRAAINETCNRFVMGVLERVNLVKHMADSNTDSGADDCYRQYWRHQRTCREAQTSPQKRSSIMLTHGRGNHFESFAGLIDHGGLIGIFPMTARSFSHQVRIVGQCDIKIVIRNNERRVLTIT